MRKILSGMLGIVMTASVVGGVAYAAFTTTATVNGINITAGTASLVVGSNSGNLATIFPANLSISNVFPGFGILDNQTTTFVVKNTGTVNLAISAQLTDATGWNDVGADLKNNVEVAINTADNTSGTGYHTLVEWNAGQIAFPGIAVTPNEERTYNVYVRVPASAPNSIQGQSLTNITFTLTGTQQ
ncbi:hypothetical protein KBD68_00640 [Candidatus Woesebacteria bacterium]|nr:hypothetical protein [Candidatus Woesebacteria bacterium]